MSIRAITHLLLHLLVPGATAKIFYSKQWQKAWLLLLIPMAIDLDHLLADPVFDPNRCSVGFHPLHSYYAIGGYCLLLVWKKSRIFAIGLLTHIILDYSDCLWMNWE